VSRGAASLDLVEKSPRAAVIVERNAAKVAKSLGRDAAIRVHRSAVSAFLGGPRGPYDLVFLDPPYDLPEGELTHTLGLLTSSLGSAAIVVIERAGRSPMPTLPDGLAHERHQKYGDTVLWWARPAV
jgi:16S rRNA (guanine966-N2)-methyltransferase